MSFEFLKPIDQGLVSYATALDEGTVGKSIHFNDQQHGVPDISLLDVAIICVLETRGSVEEHQVLNNFDHLRKSLYDLYLGNWHMTIGDLGDIHPGETVEDTYFVLREITSSLIKSNVIPIVLGGSQDLMYPMYRAFDDIKSMVNVVNVDYRFDLGDIDKPITNKNYIGKMVATEPFNLFNYSNLGYQTYYNSQHEIELLDKLYFDAVRLGSIDDDIKVTESIIRDCDFLGIDALSLKGNEILYDKGNPNGFKSAQLCSLSRYAGISDRLNAFGIFEIPCKKIHILSACIAQVIWYFLEGYNCRYNEHPVDVKSSCLRYQVPVENEVLIFYKSIVTERWWVELPFSPATSNKLNRYTLLPCDEKDYLSAINQNLPERWIKARQKNEI